MSKNALRIIRLVIGTLLIVIGAAGLILPILPGWLLIFIGIELLGIQIVFLEQLKKYVKEKLVGMGGSKEK